jgi:heme ABC exporter ATP-binding subunit CcmA
VQEPEKSPDAIRATGLSKQFDGRHVLRQVDLRIAAGESIAIMGANGAGKTTLLRCLAGAAMPDAGELWCHGKPMGRNSKATHLLGMVAHENQLYPNLTLHENLLFAARMYAVSRPRQQASDWLKRIGLLSYEKCLPRQISHGMRRRVSVARGLIHQPHIVLLDEPFSGLDREGRAWLTELMASLQQKKQSICFTTHDAEQAQLCADRVLCLENGRLQEAGVAQNQTLRLSLSPRQAA